jgi:hypothetical protein
MSKVHAVGFAARTYSAALMLCAALDLVAAAIVFRPPKRS